MRRKEPEYSSDDDGLAADKTLSTTHIGADDDRYDGGNVLCECAACGHEVLIVE